MKSGCSPVCHYPILEGLVTFRMQFPARNCDLGLGEVIRVGKISRKLQSTHYSGVEAWRLAQTHRKENSDPWVK